MGNYNSTNTGAVIDAQIDKMESVTSSAAELNILDGVTSTTAELNILDGVTSTTAELNILDGVTSTAAELNYNDITTLGTQQASKVVTADASNIISSFESTGIDDNATSSVITINSSGNVGIGTSSPEADLHVSSTNNNNNPRVIFEAVRDGGYEALSLRARDASASANALPPNQGPGIYFSGYDGSDFGTMGRIIVKSESTLSGTDHGGYMAFSTVDDASTTLDEKMRIDHNGNVCLKSPDVGHGLTSVADTNTYFEMQKASGTTGGINMSAIGDGSAKSNFRLFCYTQGSPDTTTSTSAYGEFPLRAYKHDGANTTSSHVSADANLFTVHNGGDAKFIVKADGDIYYDGADQGAYDYAEMFEWEDGNPDNEDRVGYSVSLVGEKIKKAEEGESVIGVVSGDARLCGDSPLYWHNRYKLDEWGRKVEEDVEYVELEYQHESESAVEAVEAVDAIEWEDKPSRKNTKDEIKSWMDANDLEYNSGDTKQDLLNKIPSVKQAAVEAVESKDAVYVTKTRIYEGDDIPSDLPEGTEIKTMKAMVESGDYDSSQEYIPRKFRNEWSAIGLLGKLRLRKGQPVSDSWIKMRDEGNDIEMWLVK